MSLKSYNCFVMLFNYVSGILWSKNDNNIVYRSNFWDDILKKKNNNNNLIVAGLVVVIHYCHGYSVPTCRMRFIFFSSVSAMYRTPLKDRAMAVAPSSVVWMARLPRLYSMPGTWQCMGRPATIRTCRFSVICKTTLLSRT